MEYKNYIIIVAGGSGSRMKSEIPKQFLQLSDGVPILMHTIAKFFNAIPEINIIIALPEKEIPYWEKLIDKHSFEIPHKIVIGGEARFHSVKNALNSIDEKFKNVIVGVHDGVRPLVSHITIKNCYETAKNLKNAIPCVPLKDSIRKFDIDKSYYKAEERKLFQLVQTPQCFLLQQLKKAYQTPFQDFFTDDASVVEFSGEKINIVEGNDENIKITTPADLIFANAILSTL